MSEVFDTLIIMNMHAKMLEQAAKAREEKINLKGVRSKMKEKIEVGDTVKLRGDLTIGDLRKWLDSRYDIWWVLANASNVTVTNIVEDRKDPKRKYVLFKEAERRLPLELLQIVKKSPQDTIL